MSEYIYELITERDGVQTLKPKEKVVRCDDCKYVDEHHCCRCSGMPVLSKGYCNLGKVEDRNESERISVTDTTADCQA